MYIFDLDGTITDTNGLWVEVDREFLARRGLANPPEDERVVSRSIYPIAAQFTKEYYRLPEAPEAIMAEWDSLARRHYQELAPLKPGAAEFLRQCRGEGRPMAVFTACVPEHCRAAVELHGLGEYFERIIYAQDLGADKKSPAIFRQAAELLGVKPRECVFFDDSLTACKGAKAAGMTVVGIQDDYFTGSEVDMRELCDQYIKDFGELL